MSCWVSTRNHCSRWPGCEERLGGTTAFGPCDAFARAPLLPGTGDLRRLWRAVRERLAQHHHRWLVLAGPSAAATHPGPRGGVGVLDPRRCTACRPAQPRALGGKERGGRGDCAGVHGLGPAGAHGRARGGTAPPSRRAVLLAPGSAGTGGAAGDPAASGAGQHAGARVASAEDRVRGPLPALPSRAAAPVALCAAGRSPDPAAARCGARAVLVSILRAVHDPVL